MGTYGLKAYLTAHQTAHQRVVGVAVSTVVTAGTENTVEKGSSSDNEIQLVLVAGSGVAPGYSVVRLVLFVEHRGYDYTKSRGVNVQAKRLVVLGSRDPLGS